MSDNAESVGLNKRVRFRTVADEGVLVHLDSARVIVVNEVGLRIVQLLEKTSNRKELIDCIASEFEVTQGQAAADIEHFLAELEKEQVLRGAE